MNLLKVIFNNAGGTPHTEAELDRVRDLILGELHKEAMCRT